MTSSTPDDIKVLEPRHLKTPASVGTHGYKALAFLEAIGVQLFPWQKACIIHLFAYKENDEWASTEAGLLTSRQNGKTELLASYALCLLFLFPFPDKGRALTILLSSHEARVATEIFLRMKGIIENNPDLLKRVSSIYNSAGRQEIVLKKQKGFNIGPRIKFVARRKNSGRGMSSAIVIIDEAQTWSPESYEAMKFAQSTFSNKQLFVTGTVPDENKDEYEVFEAIRDRGRAEGTSSTLWMEYTPEGSNEWESAQKIDPYDERNWEDANPSIDVLISRETIRDELERDTSPNKESFKRERLSIWATKPDDVEESNNDVDIEKWEDSAQVDPKPIHGENLTLSVQVSDSGSHASISASSELPDGRIYVEHVYSQMQTLWVPEKLKSLMNDLDTKSVILDEKKCSVIVPDLKKEKIKYFSARPSELAGAFSLFVELANNGKLVHRGQASLTESLRHAGTRNVGSYGSTWNQDDPTESITQIQSATLATYGVKHVASIKPKRGLARGFR